MSGFYNDKKHGSVFNRANYWVSVCNMHTSHSDVSQEFAGSSPFAIVIECDADSTSVMPVILPDDLLAFR